jgi:hypothetical protein
MTRAARTAVLLITAAGVAGCAVRLGGGSPQQYEALALHAPANAAAADIAAQVRAATADLVLLSGVQDSAWFATVAAEADMTLSGPGRTGPRGMAFLSRLEVVGDTSLILEVPGGGRVHMHDALLRINGNRFIDLMMVHFDAPDLRQAVQTLLLYAASDVMPNVPVLLAVEGPTTAIADSAAALMRVYYAPAVDCPEVAASETLRTLPVRLLYGPSARISCRGAQPAAGAAPGVRARVVVGR